MNQLQDANFVPNPADVTQAVLYQRIQDLWNANINQNANWLSWSNPKYKEQYDELALYALGNQGIERYRKLLSVTSAKNEIFKPYAETPSQVSKFSYRAVNLLINKLMQVQFEPVVKPIDPVFKDEKRMFEHKVKAILELQSILPNREAMLLQYGLDPASLPQNDIELEQFFAENPKYKFVRDIVDEIVVQSQIADWESVRELLVTSLVVWNVMCVISYVDENNNYNLRYVEPINMVLGADPTNNYKDINEAGCLRYLNIFEIAKHGSFTDEQIKQIARTYKINMPDGFYAYRNQYGYFSFPGSYVTSTLNNANYTNINSKIPVLDGFFLFTHNKKYVVKDGKNGNKQKRYIVENPNKTGDNVVAKYYQVWYRASWVVNGDQSMVFDFGPIRNSIIKPYDPSRPARPFHVHMPNKILGNSTSVVEAMKPYIDQAQIAMLQVQNIDSKYVPPGYLFPKSSLQNISIGDKDFDPFQLVSALRAEGNMIYDDIIDDIQNPTPNIPRPLDRPAYLLEADMWFTRMLKNLDMATQICGLNNIIQGGNPNPEVGKAQSEIALQGSIDVMSHFYRAMNRIYEEVCQDILINWQFKQATDPKSYWKDIAYRQLVVNISNAPTDADWERLYNAANIGLQQGTVDLYDFVKLQEFTNLAEARAFLQVRIKQLRIENQKISQANIEAQNQGNIQAGVAAEQEKGKNMQMQHQLNMEKINLEYDRKEQLAVVEAQAKSGVLATQAGMQLESQQQIDENRANLKVENNAMQQMLQQQQQPQMQETEMETEDEPSQEDLMSITEED